MNSTTQAFHVAHKDVRYTRWALVVYSVLVLVALVHALTLPLSVSPRGPATSNPLSATMFVLVLLGIVLAATAVQADSPVQSNAFWASRPFAPGAMLGAKLLYCGVVILGVPLIAQTIGMVRYDVTAGALAAALIKSVVVYGLILLCTVVVAGLTTDLRGFIVGALALMIGILIAVMMTLDGLSWAAGDASKAIALVIAIGTSIALLMTLYRRRGIGRVAWAGAVIVVGATVVVFGAADEPLARSVPPPSLRSAAVTLDVENPVRFLAPNRSNDGKARMAVRFNVANIPPTARLGIQIDSALLHLRDGSVVRAAAFYGYSTADNGLGALPPGFHLFGSADGPSGIGTYLTFDADSSRVVAKGMSNVDVWARVQIAEAVPLAVTRVGSPVHATVGGTRLQIFDNFDTDANAITVVAATIADPRRSTDPRDIGMAVVNESSHQGIVLTASNYSSSNDWMVLPGAPINTSVILLNTNAPLAEGGEMIVQSIPGVGPITERIPGRRSGPFPDPSWYHNAKITVVQWVPRGSYPVRLSKTLN